MRQRRSLLVVALALVVFAGKVPEARAFLVAFVDSRYAGTELGSMLSTGGTADVFLQTGVSLFESGPPVGPLVVGPPGDFLSAAVSVCNSFGCDYGSTFIPSGALLAAGNGLLWMDPLLDQAAFTITVPSIFGGGNTLRATVIMTGAGPYMTFVPLPSVTRGVPTSVFGVAALHRGGTTTGSVSSTRLGYSDTFVAGTPAFLSEGGFGVVSAP